MWTSSGFPSLPSNLSQSKDTCTQRLSQQHPVHTMHTLNTFTWSSCGMKTSQLEFATILLTTDLPDNKHIHTNTRASDIHSL